MYMRYWLKVGAATVVALAAGSGLWVLTRPPALSKVAVVTTTIPAMHTVSPQAVHWVQVVSPPPQSITPNMVWSNLVASQTLAPGTMLTSADFTAPQANGLHSGEVQWLVPVSAAASGLPTVGQRVDVWSNQNGVFHPVASGARVVGLFSSNGGPVGATSSTNPNPTAPGMVSLAIPSGALGSLLDVASPYLVVDPNQAGFRLVGSTATMPAAAATSTTTTHTTAPALPTQKGG